ncbi:Peroxiredoxin [Methanocella conradii HZ254]|uniref:Peroxiredoxin n=1 Tax=Methanocella conradii (strain DSM 24694 / JCM 17849 / CGMCC 1.5162 / HZ254) TaxID=1041930 RepID=H8IAZ1_METCZ|nr:redoxin domain-containing protein [Methanocella conradii]AFD01001.1 Peroxiredoxin [Methanocella conradii HZ254]MDI6897650.1 redoxin domain-containing protein [Methanocella conradii]
MEFGHKYEEPVAAPGHKAPGFALKDEEGRSVSLYDFIDGHSVVLVFIRDVDDAHTGELLDYLKDSYPRIRYHKGDVLAISPGSVDFNRKLFEKHKPPFHILSDEDCSALKKYGIYNEYDKLVGPCIFVLNRAGIIMYSYEGKNPEDIVSMSDVIAVLHDAMISPLDREYEI